MEAATRAPAPGRLRLVEAFVNTNDVESHRDTLATPEGLSGFLTAAGLLEPGAPVSDLDQARAIAVREALRALLLHNNGAPVAPEAADVLSEVAARSGLRPRFDAGGSSRLEPSVAGVDAALGRIVAVVHAAMADGSWPRLKACLAESCQWAFYDHSKNRSGKWCTMAVCGSRSKVRAYRARRRAA